MTMKFLMKKVLKFPWASKFVVTGIMIPATIPQVTVKVVKAVDICLLRPATLTQVLLEVVYIGHV